MAEYKAPFQIEDELDFEGTIEAQDDGSYLVGDVDPFAPIEPSLREFDDNLVSSLSEKDATTLGSEMVSDYKKDVAARADWLRVYKAGSKASCRRNWRQALFLRALQAATCPRLSTP